MSDIIGIFINVLMSLFILLLKVLNRTKKEEEETRKYSIHVILKSKNPNRKLRESNRTNLYSKPYLRPSEAVHEENEEIIIYKDKKTEFRIVRRTIKVKGIKE